MDSFEFPRSHSHEAQDHRKRYKCNIDAKRYCLFSPAQALWLVSGNRLHTMQCSGITKRLEVLGQVQVRGDRCLEPAHSHAPATQPSWLAAAALPQPISTPHGARQRVLLSLREPVTSV